MTRSMAMAGQALSVVLALGPGGEGVARRAWRYLLLGGGSLVLGLVLGGVVAAGAYLFVVPRDLPGDDVISTHEPPETARSIAGDSVVTGEHARE